MTPKLSIITPVFNNKNYISMCIENVILQECSEKIEHLIIDGGSKDGKEGAGGEQGRQETRFV